MDDSAYLAATLPEDSEDEDMDIDEEPFFSINYLPQIVYLPSELQDFLADYLVPSRILLNPHFLTQQVGDIAASCYITEIEDVLEALDINDSDPTTTFGISNILSKGESTDQVKTPLRHGTVLAIMGQRGSDSSPKTSDAINPIIRIASLDPHLRNFAQHPALKQASKRTPATGSNLVPLKHPSRYLAPVVTSQSDFSFNFIQATPQLSVSSHVKYPSYLRYSPLNPTPPPPIMSYRDAAISTPAKPHATAPWLPSRPLHHDMIKPPSSSMVPYAYIRYNAESIPVRPSPSLASKKVPTAEPPLGQKYLSKCHLPKKKCD